MRTMLYGGTIFDGTGAPPYVGSVIISEGLIEAVIQGDAPEGFVGKRVDATGFAISPGFIDVHSHNDWFAARQEPERFFAPFVGQGITTQVVGNCGFSPFAHDATALEAGLVGGGLFSLGDAKGDFRTFDGWRQAAAERTPTNLVPLVGHGAVRMGVAGNASRALTQEESSKLEKKIDECFEQGVFGLSFGLMYEPDRYAEAEALRRAAEQTARHGGVLTVHARAYSASSTSYNPPVGGEPHNLRALSEMLKVAKQTGVRMQYSHLIFVGPVTWRTMDRALTRFDQARAQGVDVAFDVFSPSFGVSVITVVLPSWYLATPREKRGGTWLRARLAMEVGLAKKALGFGFEDMELAYAGEQSAAYCGMRISEIAAHWNVSELSAYLRLVETSGGTARIHLHKYYDDGDMVKRLMQREDCLLMTDAWIEDYGLQNAAAYSAFPRFFMLGKEAGMDIAHIVHKMTGAAAERFGIAKRGFVREGYHADIVMFDAQTIAPSSDAPIAPQGIERVYINGKCVVCGGQVDMAVLRGAGEVLTRR